MSNIICGITILRMIIYMLFNLSANLVIWPFSLYFFPHKHVFKVLNLFNTCDLNRNSFIFTKWNPYRTFSYPWTLTSTNQNNSPVVVKIKMTNEYRRSGEEDIESDEGSVTQTQRSRRASHRTPRKNGRSKIDLTPPDKKLKMAEKKALRFTENGKVGILVQIQILIFHEAMKLLQFFSFWYKICRNWPF